MRALSGHCGQSARTLPPRARVAKKTRVRRGVASLELVLVMPLLAACVYALFVLTRTTLHGLTTVAEARFETFQSLREGQSDQPLDLRSPTDDGKVEHLSERSVKYDGWWSVEPVQIRSGSQSVGGPWDSRSVEFAAKDAFDVHMEPLKDIAKVIKLDGLVGTYFSTLGYTMRLLYNPVAAAPLAATKYVVVGAGLYFYVNAWPMEKAADALDAAADALDVATGGGILDTLFGGGGNGDVSTLRNAANKVRAILNPMMQLYHASIGVEVVW